MIITILMTLSSILSIYAGAVNLRTQKLGWKCCITLFIWLTAAYLTVGSLGQISIVICLAGVQIILYLFTKNLLTCTFAFLGYLVMVALNYLCTSMLGLFHIDMELISTTYAPHFSTFFWILTYVVTFLLGILTRKLLSKYPVSLSRKTSILLYLDVLACSLIFITNVVFGERLGYPKAVLIVNAVLFLTFIAITSFVLIITIRSIQREEAAKATISQLQEFQLYTDKIYQTMRSFKHNYVNILSALDGYIEQNDMQALKTYFDENIVANFNNISPDLTLLGSLGNMKIREIKGLLSTKIVKAMGKNIQFYIEISEPIESISMKPIDITQVLGIFIDNAIEETERTEEKLLHIAFINMNDFLRIQISNSCLAESYDMDKLQKDGFSTKGENHGLGLSSANSILSHYNDIVHSTRCQNHIFTQTLDIYTKQ